MGPVKNQILQQIKPDFSPTIQPWRRLNTFHHLPIMSVTFLFFPVLTLTWLQRERPSSGPFSPHFVIDPCFPIWPPPSLDLTAPIRHDWSRSDIDIPVKYWRCYPAITRKRSRGFVGRRICVGGTQSLLDSCKPQRPDKNSHDEPSWLTDGKRKPSGAERANLPLLFTHRFSGLFRGATTLCKLVKKKRKQTSPPLGKILPIDFGAFFRARSA